MLTKHQIKLQKFQINFYVLSRPLSSIRYTYKLGDFSRIYNKQNTTYKYSKHENIYASLSIGLSAVISMIILWHALNIPGVLQLSWQH